MLAEAFHRADTFAAYRGSPWIKPGDSGYGDNVALARFSWPDVLYEWRYGGFVFESGSL
jgi:hypothetical protein